MAILLGLLKWVEYQFFTRDLTLEMYIGMVGLFCTCLGGWMVWKWAKPRQHASEQTEKLPGSEQIIPHFHPDNSFGLSPREFEVLQLIAMGHSYQEIADQLCVSLSTVKTHASNIFSKMDVQRRTQAVMVAQKNGLLPPSKG